MDGEEEVQFVTIENRKAFTPSKMLENVWSNLAGREDMAKVEFFDRYLSMDSIQTSLMTAAREAIREAIIKKMVDLGKFVSACTPKGDRAPPATPEEINVFNSFTYLLYFPLIILMICNAQCCKLRRQAEEEE